RPRGVPRAGNYVPSAAPRARRAATGGRGSPRVAEGRRMCPRLWRRAVPARGRAGDGARTADVLHASPRRGVDLDPLPHLDRVRLRRVKPPTHTTEVVEPERGAGKRDGDPPGPALALATPETRDHTERQEIPGRMVERLARKRPRTLRFRRAAALLGN